jgi:hypothetical protein
MGQQPSSAINPDEKPDAVLAEISAKMIQEENGH